MVKSIKEDEKLFGKEQRTNIEDITVSSPK